MLHRAAVGPMQPAQLCAPDTTTTHLIRSDAQVLHHVLCAWQGRVYVQIDGAGLAGALARACVCLHRRAGTHLASGTHTHAIGTHARTQLAHARTHANTPTLDPLLDLVADGLAPVQAVIQVNQEAHCVWAPRVHLGSRHPEGIYSTSLSSSLSLSPPLSLDQQEADEEITLEIHCRAAQPPPPHAARAPQD